MDTYTFNTVSIGHRSLKRDKRKELKLSNTVSIEHRSTKQEKRKEQKLSRNQKRAATVGKMKPKEKKRSSGDKKVQKKLDFLPAASDNKQNSDNDSESASDVETKRRNSAPGDLAVNVSPRPKTPTSIDGAAVLHTPPRPKGGSSLMKNRRKLFNPNESFKFSPSTVPSTPVESSPYWKDSSSKRSRSRTTSSKRPRGRRDDGSADKKTAPRPARRSLVPLMEQDEEELANYSKNSLSCFDLKKKGGLLTRPQPRICFTSLRSHELTVYQDIVADLGAFEIDKSVTKKTTHLLSSVPPRRTVNLLRAIARGCWILDIDWLTFCKENDKWMSEEPFELKYFSKAVAKNRLERQAFGKNYSSDIFVNCEPIFVDPNVQPPQSEVVELLKICKARIVPLASAKIVISNQPIDDDSSDVTVVSPLWVLDSITHNKLCELNKYVIT